MFSGLIRQLGLITHRDALAGGIRMHIQAIGLSLKQGDSIAVNGACLTAIDPDEQGFAADVSTETLARTTLGQLADGSQVNLEPPISLATALDGHLVTGHVDAVGVVRSCEPAGEAMTVWFDLPASLLPMVAEKGSIAVEGISLTVNAVDQSGFAVMLIPHTQTVTTLHQLAAGRSVNIEVDLIARYVARMLNFTAK